MKYSRLKKKFSAKAHPEVDFVTMEFHRDEFNELRDLVLGIQEVSADLSVDRLQLERSHAVKDYVSRKLASNLSKFIDKFTETTSSEDIERYTTRFKKTMWVVGPNETGE